MTQRRAPGSWQGFSPQEAIRDARRVGRDLAVREAVRYWEEHVPVMFADATWDKVVNPPAPHHPFEQEMITDLDEWFQAGPVTDLVLFGTPGTGKSFIAAALARRICETRGLPGEFWRASVFFEAVRPPRAESVDSVGRVPVLVFDDIAANRSTLTEWQAEQIDTLLSGRIDAGLRTIMTTNLEAEDLRVYLGPRLESRLRQATMWEVTGQDRRALKPVRT